MPLGSQGCPPVCFSSYGVGGLRAFHPDRRDHDKDRAEGGIAGVGGLSVEMELKTNDIDGLFRSLEQARKSNVDFS